MKNSTQAMLDYLQIDPHLFLISLPQKVVGFRNFISSWLYRDENVTFLVDPGPAASIGLLKNALGAIGVDRLDYIFLTHIHIDHAGGTGKILSCFPEAQVVCHPVGIKHLVNPAKLWIGSLQVLGEIAEAYGEIVSVPQEKVFFAETVKKGGDVIEAVETPGHAAHHVSYFFRQYVFAGEVAGVHQPLKDRIYVRPATPPPFRLETSLASLDKVIGRKPEIICYGHYGIREEAGKVLSLAREQLVLWTDQIREALAEGEDNLSTRSLRRLLDNDTIFSNFMYLETDIQKREYYFITNGIKGIKEYLVARARG